MTQIYIFMLCFLIGIIVSAEEKSQDSFQRFAINEIDDSTPNLVDIERYVGNIIRPQKDGKQSLFVIHVTSFKDEFEAIKVVKQLQKSEANVYYRPINLEGTQWYRVYAGQFKNMEEAQDFLVAFQGKTELKDLVVAEVREDESYKIVSEKVRAVASTPKSTESFSLQIGSFPERVLAVDKSQVFLEKNIEVEIVEAEIKGQKWYRLYVGKFKSKNEALNLRKKLGTHIPKDSIIKKRGPRS